MNIAFVLGASLIAIAACGSGGAETLDAGLALVDASVELDASSGCNTGKAVEGLEFEHGGKVRTALVHLPANYDGSPTPVVFNFHGNTSSAQVQRQYSAMDATADTKGFIVVYPEGFENSWNAGFCCGQAQSQNIDDVDFAVELIDELAKVACVDRSRVFATGLSNGGYLAHRLACERPEQYAAFSSVAGLLAISPCEPSVGRPILQLHGTADAIVGYAGGLGAVATMNAWATRNGCDLTTTSTFSQGDASCIRYDGCDGSNDVELCTITGGGHTWPGAQSVPSLGATSTDIDANDWMWAFFEEHAP